MISYSNAKPTMLKRYLSLAAMISLLSMAFAISGCTVGPDYVKPEAKIDKNWSQKDDLRVVTDTTVNSKWWTAFNDQTLNQLIELAYQQNLPLQISGLRILEARARLGIAVGEQYPQQQEVFGSAAAGGFSDNMSNSARLDRFHGDYQLGFDATWEMDFWGKFRRGVQAETANLIASVTDYDFATVSLTAEVARTYDVIRTFEVLINLARENIKVQEEGLKIAESRFRNGATTELDVTQARSLLESTRATIPQLEIGLQQAQNALATLLGQTVGQVCTLLDGPKGIPTAPKEVAVGLPAELLRRRPDVRSAEYYAVAQSARIGIAKADLYPSFALFGEIGLQSSSQGGDQSNNANFHNVTDSDSIFYTFGPEFRWPFFNYGRIKNNVRIQDSRYQQLLVNYQNTVLIAAQEVEDALTGFLKSQEAEVFQQNSVNNSQRSVDIALSQYREGAVDYQRVLDTQRALLQEQNSLAQTRSSIATNLIALYKALGGGWELRQGQPIVAQSTQSEMQQRTNWGRLLRPSPTPETFAPPVPARDIPLLQKPDW